MKKHIKLFKNRT